MKVLTLVIFFSRLSFQLCLLYTLTEIRFLRTKSIEMGLARRTMTCKNKEKVRNHHHMY